MRGICNRDSVWAGIRPEIAGRLAAGTERGAQRRGTNREDAAGSLKTAGRVQVGLSPVRPSRNGSTQRQKRSPVISSQIENLV